MHQIIMLLWENYNGVITKGSIYRSFIHPWTSQEKNAWPLRMRKYTDKYILLVNEQLWWVYTVLQLQSQNKVLNIWRNLVDRPVSCIVMSTSLLDSMREEHSALANFPSWPDSCYCRLLQVYRATSSCCVITSTCPCWSCLNVPEIH